MDNCLAPTSDGGGYGCDNMTVIIVGLLNGKTKEQWYDMVAERVSNKDGPVAAKKFGIAPVLPTEPFIYYVLFLVMQRLTLQHDSTDQE